MNRSTSMESFTEYYKNNIIKLLKQYKLSPCLWNYKHPHYFNRPVRNESYRKLLAIWQTLEPEATIHDVKKKIEYMRTCFRREQKKVEELVSCGGHDFKSGLWYYDQLTFLIEENCDTSGSEDTEIDNGVKKIALPRKSPVNAIKRKAVEPLESPNESSDSTSIDAQLQDLDEHQRNIAKRLISEVIQMGQNRQLMMETILVNMTDVKENSTGIVFQNIKHESAPESATSSSHLQQGFDKTSLPGQINEEFLDETATAVNFLEELSKSDTTAI